MFNVCAHCGLYSVDKLVARPTRVADEPESRDHVNLQDEKLAAVATCKHCGHAHTFLRLPLLLIGGASATGKSAILQELAGCFSAAVLLEADLLWLQEFEKPPAGHRRFFETWLRLAKNIGQSRRPVTLFGAGLAVPENIEHCEERRYFSDTHYLALVCDENELQHRLRARPAWRKSGQPEQLQEQLDFNRWLQNEGPLQTPGVTLLDTTDTTVEDSARAVKDWIERSLALEPLRADE